jgi:hypothetical protein
MYIINIKIPDALKGKIQIKFPDQIKIKESKEKPVNLKKYTDDELREMINLGFIEGEILR